MPKAIVGLLMLFQCINSAQDRVLDIGKTKITKTLLNPACKELIVQLGETDIKRMFFFLQKKKKQKNTLLHRGERMIDCYGENWERLPG